MRFEQPFKYWPKRQVYRDMRRFQTEHVYIVCVLLLIFGLFQLSVSRLYGFTLYPDEFGYWSSAAALAGYDWSSIASIGSYYSYGYSFVLFPLLLIFKDGVVLYRAAIALNYMFVAGSFMLLYRIVRIIYNRYNDRIRLIMFCAVAVLYPPWIMFSQTTMAESLVFFLFNLLCYFFVEYLRDPKITRLIPIALTCAYMYTVHMRLIGVILAFVIVFLILGLMDERTRRLVLVLIGIAIVAMVIIAIIKRKVISNVFTYADQDNININSYEGQSVKIAHILTPEGFRLFLTELLGKVYYLLVGTFGMLVPFILSSVRGISAVIKGLRIKQGVGIAAFFKLFVFMATVAEVLISAIYMHLGFRTDALLYGRYEEFVAPVMIVIGLQEVYRLIRSRRIERLLVCALGTVICMALLAPIFVRYVADNEEAFTAKPVYFFTGAMSYFSAFNETDYSLFIWRGVLTGVVMVAIVYVVTYLSTVIRGGAFVLVLVMVAELLLGGRLSRSWTYRVNEYVYTNISLLEEFEEHPERPIYYLNSGVANTVDFFQFNMRDTEIKLVTPEELPYTDIGNGYLLVDWSYWGMDDLKAMYGQSIERDMFTVFYNE